MSSRSCYEFFTGIGAEARWRHTAPEINCAPVRARAQLIQEYLGHKSARTTTLYTHLTPELRAAALEPINSLTATLHLHH